MVPAAAVLAAILGMQLILVQGWPLTSALPMLLLTPYMLICATADAEAPPGPALLLQLLVIPTDEELSIAQQTLQVIREEKGTAAAA